MSDKLLKCPQCKGKGHVGQPIDWFAAVFTLGMTALVDKSNREECRGCDGRGWIKL